MGKRHIRPIILISASLLLSQWPVFGIEAAGNGETEALNGMKKAAENDSLILYLDEEDTDIAVYVKETGDIWFSNPQASDNDILASDYYIRQMKSQIALRYFNENVQERSMDNYSDAISEGQFTIDYQDNGVTITYTMGEQKTKLLLPEVISVERMEQFTALMPEADAKRVLRNYSRLSLEGMRESEKKENLEKYPGLEQHDIYTLRSSVRDYIREELAEYMAAAGYTEEDLEFDMEDNGYQTEKNDPWFTVPLTYRLEGESLAVEVDPQQISYNEDGYYLVDVELLPYFGAAGSDEEGYIFVPDGCGALIYLNNGSSASSYGARVYGQDLTMNTLNDSKSEVDQSLTIKMPVFGIKTGEKAWMAVIGEGDGYADISAQVSGQTTSYNAVHAGFQYLEYGSSSLGDMVGSNSFQMYSKPSFEGQYRILFSFLHGEDADYSGMAQHYRNYLLEKGILKNRSESETLPFYVEYIGAIDKYTTFLGFKHRAVYPTTTYRQAKEITDALLETGIDNVNVIYSGWANGGLHGKAYTQIHEVKELGNGGLKQSEFLEYMGEKEVDVFLTAELQYVYRGGLMDGYSSMGNAPKYFDRSSAQAATYFLDTNTVDKENMIDLISPFYVSKVSSALAEQADKRKGAGVNLGSICYNLYTDQLTEKYTDRQAALRLNTEAAAEVAESCGGRIMGDNANSYMLGQVSDIINVPLDSNRYLIIDETVPFYEMVLHGYIDYAGDCLNMADDYNTALLKSLETGAGLYFKWMYEENSIVKETDFDDLYSVNYKAWLMQALEDYRKANQVLAGLQGEIIVRHEILSEKVVRVTYEKGTQIIVNYSKADVDVDGVSVEAGGYAVVNQHE